MADHYEWASGPHPFHRLDPEEIASALEEVRERYGMLTARFVVEAANDEASSLHEPIFHVGRNAAAALYYETRAQLLVRCVRVRISNGEEREPVRAFVSVGRNDHEYHPAALVSEDPELRALYRAELIKKMRFLDRELAAWDEFAQVRAAIGEVLAA